MSKIQSKQVEHVQSAYVRVAGLSASGGSNTVTTAITTALSTAGRLGVSVPLQVSATENAVGVITTGSYNRVELWNGTTKQKMSDASGNEIFGRLTQSGGVYTLTYYTIQSGTETAYTFASATTVDIEFAYRFDFHRIPADSAIGVKQRNVDDDSDGGGGDIFQEQITVTALNTLNALTKTPVASTAVVLLVNGVAYSPAGGSAPFTVTGKTISWSSTNATFDIETTDRVIAHYTTFE